MAYVSKEKKAKIAAALKVALKNEDIKYSLAVRHGSSIHLTIISGSVDFFNQYLGKTEYNEEAFNKGFQVNTYHYDRHFSGKSRAVMGKILKCLNIDNFDRSDSQSDYFCVGHYVDLTIGRWNKPYVRTAPKAKAKTKTTKLAKAA